MNLPGPRGPIRVERDALGYPTIYARDLTDATWARGYMHATDRLAQIHFVLAAGRGELQSLFGPRRFARAVDRAVRAFGFANDLDTQVSRLEPKTRAWLDTYCDGFNAGAARRGTPALLRLLGRRVELYTPKSIMIVYRLVCFFGLTSMQQTAELIVAELISRGAPREVFDTLLGDSAEGLDLESLRGLTVADDYSLLAGSAVGGSNAFAISGRASRSGHALLMGEFHMEVGKHPPVLYASHVEYDDGTYYQGMGLPGVGWNSCGRSDVLAFSHTFGHADNVDILAERCKDERHLVAGEWRPLTRRVERVRVRGKREPERWVFYDNEYGTVLGDASREGTYPCVRWSGHDDLASDLTCALEMITARSVDEAIAVSRRYSVISLQGVFADSAGNVGEVQLGRVDQRPAGWTGAYPRAGWHVSTRTPASDEAARPEPTRAADRIVAANHRPAGERGKRWATLPEPHDRFDRITELLADVDDLDGMVRVSYDAFDRCAARLTAIWSPHLPKDPDARALVRWAEAQNDRSQLGLFQALHGEVFRALLERWIGARETTRILDDLFAGLLFQYHVDRVLALEVPAILDASGLRDLLARAWPRAKASKTRETFPIVRRFSDPVTNGKLGGAFGLCSAPITFPGAPCAPFQTRVVRFEDESLAFGPAFHYVTDLGERGGWYHVPGGASERRTGPGYGKGIDLWVDGRFIPLGPTTGTPPRPPR